jgi:D-arabinose 1-dehydrogenase-like Zn-dependent alcohol dehydrogenase
MLSFAAEHGLRPAVEIMPMSQPNEAIERIRGRELAAALVLES